jgi:penicillin-binding protein 1C
VDRPGGWHAAPALFRLFDLLPDEAPVPEAAESDPPGARAPSLLRLPGKVHPADFLRIIYPPPGAVLELHPGVGLALEAAGGTRPYRWIVNGLAPPQAGAGMAPSRVPDGPGFAHLTLTDAAARSVEETVRVR